MFSANFGFRWVLFHQAFDKASLQNKSMGFGVSPLLGRLCLLAGGC